MERDAIDVDARETGVLDRRADGVERHRARAERHANGTNQYDPPASKEFVAAIAGADPLRH